VLGGAQPPGSRPPWFGDGPPVRAASYPAGGSGLSRPRGPQRPGRNDRQAADTAARVPPRLRRGRGAPAADGQRRSSTPRCLRRRDARALLPDGGPLARLRLPVHRCAGAGRPPNDPTASAVSLRPGHGEWTGAVNHAIHPCAVPSSSTRQR
jgi:hypothetical protein